MAVQSPRLEAMFLHAVHGGSPLVLGEDFCGGAGLARAWVRYLEGGRAVCVDADPEPLAHAQLRAREEVGSDVDLSFSWETIDVRACTTPVDVIAAFNFAACELHEREDLLAWIRAAHARLQPSQGILALDVYGGPGSLVTGEGRMEIEDPEDPAAGVFTYCWLQQSINPLTARVRNRIDFILPDGSHLEGAFAYNWRLWTVAELRDVMMEAGFTSTEVYTNYGDAMDGDGNLLVREADPEELADEEDWVAYVVGRTAPAG